LKKVLVIRFSSLGDIILSTAVVRPLYEAGFSVDFLTLKPFDQIFIKDYRLRNIISPDKKELKGFSIIKYREKLKDYTYIIDLHKNLRSYSLTLFNSGKKVRYKKNSIKRRAYTYPFFRKLIKNDFNVVKAYTDTLKKLGIKNSNYRPEVVITEEEKEKATYYLPEKYIVIGTGARYENKIYRRYDRVSEILIKKGFNVVLVGSLEDKKIDRNIYPEKVIDLRGKLTVRESLAVISKACLTISNDSAIAHMSRAVGTPVSVVFGATHPYFGFAPFKDEGIYLIKGVSCQPCDIHGKKTCKRKSNECLDISPEIIVDKSLSVIK